LYIAEAALAFEVVAQMVIRPTGEEHPIRSSFSKFSRNKRMNSWLS
jgi:hypothetical protein